MRFQNLDPRHARPTRRDGLHRLLIERGLFRNRRPADGEAAPIVAADAALIHQPEGPPRVTWIGHASVLLQLSGRNILVDPVFSSRVGWIYGRRVPPGLTPDQLPPIDAILLTHNHYDHFDVPSLCALPRSATIVAPSRLGEWFCRQGFARVVELGWWESVRIADLTITSVPSRHWSRRSLFDTNATLWCGYVVEGGEASAYHAGDSAWFDGFREIGERFPGLAAAMLPIGGYEPRWFMQHNHFTPEEAGEAFRQVGAERFIPIHWGTFRLSDEPLREPIERLRAWWAAQADLESARLAALAVGETLIL